jgi:glucose/arabinose dehydrogenase
MPVSPPRKTFALCLAGVLLAACSSSPPTAQPSSSSGVASSTVPAAGLVEAAVDVPAGLGDAPFDEPRKALVPNGWTLSVWARMTKPRLAVWAPDGLLLVSVPSTGQVVALRADGSQDKVLIDGLDLPHGLAFEGSTLYVAQSDEVDAYSYTGGSVGAARVVAPGLPDAKSPDLRGAYSHALKSVVVGSDGAVYFSIGSTGNISVQDRTATPPRATIMRVPPGGGPAAPFATGVRNGTGLAVAPDGAVWIANNGRDNAPDPDGNVRAEYVNDHPPEQVAKLTPGRELGWPYCNPDGGPANLPFIRDMNTNADGSAMDCAALPPVEQSMGAHSAPLGMSFADLPEPFGSGALIGVHGSWNRQPPRAPEVSFYPWRDGGLGDQQTLVGGFQTDDGSRWGRPVAAVLGPDGAVYITDDYANAIYRLAPA